jgi:hypothetical protein
MFLAMVFFLLCFFVGGSVLAAATANGGRLTRSQESMASYYAQRSAVTLLREQFTNPTKTSIKLNTTNNTIITTTSGGVTTMERPDTTYGYEVVYGDTQTALQTLASNAAVTVYQQHNTDDSRLTSWTDTACQGDFTIELDGEVSAMVRYVCNYTDSGDFGDIVFYVYTNDLSDSQFSLVVPASVNVVKTTSNASDTGNNTLTITRTTTESVNITWGTPEIQKGGAA